MRYGAEDWDEVVALLQTAREVTIACHANPDGDALGSLLGASLGLRKLGKTVAASWGAEAPSLPLSYDFLPGAALLVAPDALRPSEVFLALDCGAAERLGLLEETARASDQLINVDHHPGNELFGTLNIVVPDASSTAEIVTRLLQDLGVDLDEGIATCLYTGIVTDTGRFQYSNSTPETLRLAADLLALGVPAPEIGRQIFESPPFEYLKLVGLVLSRAVLIAPLRFVYSWVELNDLERMGVAADDTDKLIDVLRATRAADVAALFKEQEDGRWRVSLRSKGPSVGAIARAEGGGGHDLAAGFTADDMNRAIGEITNRLAA